MKDCMMTVAENVPLTKEVYRMVLAGDVSAFTAPGQFLNLKLEGQFLRRPISLCDLGEDSAAIIYQVVGKGTAQMASMLPGEELSVLTGLGNGYDLTDAGEAPLLIGGGVGVPPCTCWPGACGPRERPSMRCWASTRPPRSSMRRKSGPWAAPSP